MAHCPSDTIRLCLHRWSRTGVEQMQVALDDMINCPAATSDIPLCGSSKANGGTLYRHLRRGHKRYRKGKNSKQQFSSNRMNALR